jgi:Uma2 family endonuclease
LQEADVALVAPRPWTIEEFLDWEGAQTEPYEWIDGVIRMMTGGTIRHATIKGNIFAALRSQLQGRDYRAFIEGPKLVMADAMAYPDVLITCGPVDPKEDRLTDATVIIEVLSRSTADYDRGSKWVVYRSLASLQHYVLVAQDRRRVEVHTRTDDGDWRLSLVEEPDTVVELAAVSCRLTMSEIYEDSGLPAP